MAVDILELLRQRHSGEPTPQEPSLYDVLASGAEIEYPEPEPPGFTKQALDIALGTAELPLTLSTGIVGTIGGGLAGLPTYAAEEMGYVSPGTATKVIENVADFLTYKPMSRSGKEAAAIAMKPFEIVHESSDWWGQKVAGATNNHQLGAFVASMMEAGILFATPVVAKSVPKSNLLKLRRKLGRAERTGNFNDPDITRTIHDVMKDLEADPALLADINRYAESWRVQPPEALLPEGRATTGEPAPAGDIPPQIGGPGAPGGGGQRALPSPRRTTRDIARDRIERRRLAKVAGVELEPEGPRLGGELAPEGGGTVALPLETDIPRTLYDIETRKPVPFQTDAWIRTREQITRLRGEEQIMQAPESVAEALGIRYDGIWEDTGLYQWTDLTPKQETTFYTESPEQSSVAAKLAVKRKAYGPSEGAVKSTPISQATKYNLEYKGAKNVETLSETGEVGVEQVHEYFDPQTGEYFTADSVKSVKSELERHRANVAERTSKFGSVEINDFAGRVKPDMTNEELVQLKDDVLEAVSKRPKNTFDSIQDSFDFVDRGEELAGIINKELAKRGVKTETTAEQPLVDTSFGTSEVTLYRGIGKTTRDRRVNFYSTKKSHAGKYAESKGTELVETTLPEGSNVLDLRPLGPVTNTANVSAVLKEAGVKVPKDMVASEEVWPHFGRESIKRTNLDKAIKDAGYDGVVYKEGTAEVPEGVDTYALFKRPPDRAPVDVVKVDAKLNDGNISKPKMLKPEERIAYMKEWQRKRSKLIREQIEEAIADGEDIADYLPEEAQAAYEASKELYEYSIESSEPRGIGEIISDVNTYFKDKGGLSIQDVSRLEKLNAEQRAALQRLVADAKRLVGDLTDYLADLGLTPEQITIIKRQIDEIRKTEPETFGEPRQHWIDARAIEKGDTIIKQRKPGRGRQSPPVYNSERQMLLDMQELNRPVNEKIGLQNPIRTLERLDPEGTGIKQVYYDYRQAEQLYRREFDTVKDDIRSLRSGLSFKSRKRIGAYAIAQQERGLNILKNMNVEVPRLTSQELAIYDALRSRFEQFYERIQRTREMIGKKPLEKVDNYFTFFRTFSVLEKAGIKINPLLDRPSVVNSLYAKYGSTPFRFGISRIKKGAIPVELDPFKIYENYANTALRHIHLSPWVAKMNELMLTLPDPKTGKLTWRLNEKKPNAHHFLRHWVNHISGHASPLQLSSRVDRILSRLSQNLAYSILGANVRSALIQPTALRNTLGEIGFKYTLEGIKDSLTDISMATKNRKFALEHSKILDSRTYDAAVADAVRSISSGKLGDIYQAIGRASFKPLQMLDMETAIASWNGAFKLAKSRGMKLSDAVNFADDVVTRTQASALPGDLAPIQRSAAGKAFTLFQTFVINDWGFLTRDVLGLGNPKISNKIAVRKVSQYLAATIIFNTLLEEAGVQSPFPTPIRDVRRSVEQGDPLGVTAQKVAFGLLDPIPIIGSARYGKGPGGPVLELGKEIVESLQDRPLSRPLPEVAGRVFGVPGATQYGKIQRGRKRGESLYGQIVGKYSPTESGGNRPRNRLGGLKGLGSLSGF